jgi:hypothetical protein
LARFLVPVRLGDKLEGTDEADLFRRILACFVGIALPFFSILYPDSVGRSGAKLSSALSSQVKSRLEMGRKIVF